VFVLQLEQKQKYAAWKAADIRKALKEGRKPMAGPPAGDDDLSVPLSSSSNRYVRFETQPDVL
jgi:vacuolar protein sorting-associated protein VTA1